MTTAKHDTHLTAALRALRADHASVRLRAALALGTTPAPRHIAPLIDRCADEPDFQVRETLTWALTRHPTALTTPGLLRAIRSEPAQARSQALHTLSKTGDRQAWPAIPRALLSDADDEVARAAWRAAVVLVPDGAEAELAAALASQLGRGERETRLSLSRALIALGSVSTPVLHAALRDLDPCVREHALATERLSRDPDAGFESAIEEAKRIVALGISGQEE